MTLPEPTCEVLKHCIKMEGKDVPSNKVKIRDEGITTYSKNIEYFMIQ